jgi:ribosomal protein S18 acetylase RimI-like enzyme
VRAIVDSYTSAVYAADLRGAFDLLRMMRLTQAAWSLGAYWHVGDLAWQRRFHSGPSDEWPTRLWLDDDEDRPVAWAWVARPDRLQLCVMDPLDAVLLDELLDWAIAVVGERAPLTTSVMESQHELRAALEARGFTRTDDPGLHLLSSRPEDVAAAPAPPGFEVRGLAEGDAESVARAQVHVASWESTTMTPEVYRRLQRTWPYRHDLDVVAEVLDGPSRPSSEGPRFAASCLGWLDDLNLVGELEPVGTHPDFRRRGLAAAVCAAAVRQLGAAGARLALVCGSADPARPGPLALYRSIGFEVIGREFELRRN